jgi:hypothetical protein
MNFFAHIESGLLRIDTPDKWKRFLTGFDEGTRLDIQVEKHSEKRSMNQHRYYHLYLDVIEQETGNDHVEMHEYFKRKFLKPKEITVMGETIRVPSSTKDLSKHEMTEYLDKICALTEVPLPDPELAGYEPNNKPMTASKLDYPTEYSEPLL